MWTLPFRFDGSKRAVVLSMEDGMMPGDVPLV